MPKKPIEKFARKCDATGEGMNDGYCFGDGERYFKRKKHAIGYAKKIGYKTLNEAYDDDAYYWTDWEIDVNDEICYDAKGNEYKIK